METVIPVAEICSELGGLVRTTMRVRVWELARCDWNRDAFDFGVGKFVVAVACRIRGRYNEARCPIYSEFGSCPATLP